MCVYVHRYMVFILNGDVYSTAQWVTLSRPYEGEPGYLSDVGVNPPPAIGTSH